ncbi:MAG: hypothetical protein AABZ06_13425 [Bdellovibrionota bacterium]
MSRWKSKACPRCGGDMFVDRDLDSWYEQCLQCSYRMELKPLAAIKEPVNAGERGSKKRLEAEQPQHAS